MSLFKCASPFPLLLVAAIASGEPVLVGTGTQPQLTAAPDRSIFVTYGRGKDVFVARSTDAGKTFAPPSLVANVLGLPLGMRRGPRIAASKDSLVITAVESAIGGGKDGDVFAWISTDEGSTWKKSEHPLNSVPASAREGLHAMASDGKGRVAVVWLDLRHAGQPAAGTEIWLSESEDGGKTWKADKAAYSNKGGTVCECCHPSVAFEEGGKLIVMFRNVASGARDMFLTESADGGNTFSAAEKLGTGTWPLNACPMDGGSIISTNDGLLAVWRRDRDVFLSPPDKGETKLGQGSQPVLAVDGKNTYFVWQRGTELVGKRGNEATFVIAKEGSYPSALSGPAGSALVAWQSGGKVFVDRLSSL